MASPESAWTVNTGIAHEVAKGLADEPISKLEAMTCSKLDNQRCQFLCRFVRCVRAVAAMILECRASFSAAPLAEAPFLCFTHLSQQAAGFQDWVNAAKADFLGMIAQWELLAIDIDGVCKQTVLMLQPSMAAIIAGRSDQAKALAAEAKALSPSRGLVESARVLAGPDMHAMLTSPSCSVKSGASLRCSRSMTRRTHL